MSDNCECVWIYENAMARLMNMIGSTETVCNNNECLTSNSSSQSLHENANSVMQLFIGAMMLLLLAVVFLYRRNNTAQPVKHQNTNANDPDYGSSSSV
ncbi:hypothetical protein A3Q56_01673 [Intoshia linei]|uniref:Small integral membrane protein 14 n=1 Tax=Intoshia linei TaxID=1819745 RepID=A0A177B8H7_9BILA|nr:hypothetical protein A3Q56_01673 [Intoshia linei]